MYQCWAESQSSHGQACGGLVRGQKIYGVQSWRAHMLAKIFEIKSTVVWVSQSCYVVVKDELEFLILLPPSPWMLELVVHTTIPGCEFFFWEICQTITVNSKGNSPTFPIRMRLKGKISTCHRASPLNKVSAAEGFQQQPLLLQFYQTIFGPEKGNFNHR